MRENEMHKIKQEERATISHGIKGLQNINPEMGNLTLRSAPLIPRQPSPVPPLLVADGLESPLKRRTRGAGVSHHGPRGPDQTPRRG